MINANTVFDELGNKCALWCGAGADAGDLARATEIIFNNHVNIVSVAPEAVKIIWPWVEEKGLKIISRFYFPENKITEKHVSDITVQINCAFKQGANGAQVFLPYNALDTLVDQTHMVRDDLFFNRDLSIGIDIADVDSFDWGHLFDNLQKINASALLLVLTHDAGDKSDFVGRLYGMLNSWDSNNKFDLHFAFGPNFMRIEQVVRLVESVRPELSNRLKFFINI